MSVMEGMMGSFTIGGTVPTLLAGIDLSWSRKASEWASMGETATSDVLLGVKQVKGTAKKAFVNWAYRTIFLSGTPLPGTIYPVGGTTTYIAGTIAVTGGKLSNMQQNNENAVIEDIDFILYNVTQSP